VIPQGIVKIGRRRDNAVFFDGNFANEFIFMSLIADQSTEANIRLRGRSPRGEFERRRMVARSKLLWDDGVGGERFFSGMLSFVLTPKNKVAK
jgi:hypothetical protein